MPNEKFRSSSFKDPITRDEVEFSDKGVTFRVRKLIGGTDNFVFYSDISGVEIDNGVMQVFERRQAVQQHRGILMRAERRNRLYVMRPKLTSPVCQLSKMEEAAWLWHARYGHLNFRSLHELASKEMVQGLPRIRGVEQVCDGCVLGK